ncbi:hypothetical protein EJB05_16114, partial [Eragrostis curvula]
MRMSIMAKKDDRRSMGNEAKGKTTFQETRAESELRRDGGTGDEPAGPFLSLCLGTTMSAIGGTTSRKRGEVACATAARANAGDTGAVSLALALGLRSYDDAAEAGSKRQRTSDSGNDSSSTETARRLEAGGGKYSPPARPAGRVSFRARCSAATVSSS